MFRSARKQAQTIATLGIAAALAVGGVAAAQGGSQGNQGSPGGQGDQGGHPAGPPPFALPMQGLTYAQIHVDKNGQEQTIRVDQGKIAAVSDSSITLTENDGSEVTIPVEEGTKVMGKPGAETTVADLSTGQQVIVCAPEGGSAKTIVVLPKKGQGGPPQGEGQEGEGGQGQQPPPPPGAQQGGQQQGGGQQGNRQ